MKMLSQRFPEEIQHFPSLQFLLYGKERRTRSLLFFSFDFSFDERYQSFFYQKKRKRKYKWKRVLTTFSFKRTRERIEADALQCQPKADQLHIIRSSFLLENVVIKSSRFSFFFNRLFSFSWRLIKKKEKNEKTLDPLSCMTEGWSPEGSSVMIASAITGKWCLAEKSSHSASSWSSFIAPPGIMARSLILRSFSSLVLLASTISL